MSLQALIEKIRKKTTEVLKLCEAAEVMRKALYGDHDNCNYLAAGFCNKCGAMVNSDALKKADAIARGEE